MRIAAAIAATVVIAPLSLALGAPMASARPTALWISQPELPGRSYGTINGRPSPLVRVGEEVTVRGRATGVRRRDRVVVQDQVGEAGRWQTLATARVHGARVELRFRAPEGFGRVIRLGVLGPYGGLLLAGAPLELVVGSATVPCLAPVVPPLPSGEGAIVGGVILGGGPSPGGSWCGAPAGTVVELLDAENTVVATQSVSRRTSYVFVVAPGTYTLRTAGAGCFRGGPATVTAGKVTQDDAVCGIP